MGKLAYFMLIASVIDVLKADFILPNLYGEDANQGHSWTDVFRNAFQGHSYPSQIERSGHEAGYETGGRDINDFGSDMQTSYKLTRKSVRRPGSGRWKRSTTVSSVTTIAPGDDPHYWVKPLTKEQIQKCEEMAEYPNRKMFKLCDKFHMELWDLQREATKLKGKMENLLRRHKAGMVDLTKKEGDTDKKMEFITLIPRDDY